MRTTKLSLKEYLLQDVNCHDYLLSHNANLRFHWSDNHLCFSLVKNRMSSSFEKNILRLKEIFCWIKIEEEARRVSFFEIYQSLLFQTPLRNSDKAFNDFYEVSFVHELGPFKKVYLGDLLDKDLFLHFVCSHLYHHVISQRDFRLKTQGICQVQSSRRLFELEVAQLTMDGILLICYDPRFKKILSKRKKMTLFIDEKIFNETKHCCLSETTHFFSKQEAPLFYERTPLKGIEIDNFQFQFLASYDSLSHKKDYIYLPLDTLELKGENLKEFMLNKKYQLEEEIERV